MGIKDMWEGVKSWFKSNKASRPSVQEQEKDNVKKASLAQRVNSFLDRSNKSIKATTKTINKVNTQLKEIIKADQNRKKALARRKESLVKFKTRVNVRKSLVKTTRINGVDSRGKKPLARPPILPLKDKLNPPKEKKLLRPRVVQVVPNSNLVVTNTQVPQRRFTAFKAIHHDLPQRNLGQLSTNRSQTPAPRKTLMESHQAAAKAKVMQKLTALPIVAASGSIKETPDSSKKRPGY